MMRGIESELIIINSLDIPSFYYERERNISVGVIKIRNGRRRRGVRNDCNVGHYHGCVR